MSRFHRLVLRDIPRPILEIDPKARGLYVRLRRGKVARTVTEDRPGMILAMDYNAAGEVLGIECISEGRLFRIGTILKQAKVEMPDMRDVQLKVVS